jgi:hypothetical protein
MAISARAITILDVFDSGCCCVNGSIGLRVANLLSAIPVYSVRLLPFPVVIIEAPLIEPR